MFTICQTWCLAAISLLSIGCSHLAKVAEMPLNVVASTVGQIDLFQNLDPRQVFDPRFQQPNFRLGRYLDAANDARLELAEDPGNQAAKSDYNFAVARITEIIEEENLTPWDKPLSCDSQDGKPWVFSLPPPDPRPEYHPSNFDIRPSDRYRFRGKLVGPRILKEGLGAPVIVSGKDLDFTQFDPFAQGKKVYYGFTAVIQFEGRKAKYIAYDPLQTERITFDHHTFPLAADFQGPLAMSMVESHPRKMGLGLMFRPDKQQHTGRLSRLQIYNPDKIPVILIHGLGDSRATWTPMINFLRQDETIRRHYQFWIFSYPTGLPYALPAATLRRQLDLMNERYPNHKDVVIVGHSLGGNISRLLLSDSGMTLWDTYFDKPPDEIPFSEENRKLVSNMFVFDARHDISRVIFASASLRGSNKAVNFLGRLGSTLIGNPITQGQVSEEVIANMRPGLREKGMKHLPNSIDMLDPGSLFLETVDRLPIAGDIPYHSIMGDRGKGGNLNHTKPVSTDGIVPYWSAHLDGAESETIIPSHHWTILHPDGMEEVKRILLLHIE